MIVNLFCGKKHRCLLLVLLCAFFFPTAASAKSFQAEGSDLMMGVGAEAIALAGAVSARTKSIYSVYWNPAGLVEMEESQVSISGMLNSKILPVNFAGVAVTGQWLNFAGFKTAVALSWIPRLHVQASGAYSANDLESMFLRFAMPDLPEDFDGVIESKTKDYRLSMAITPDTNPGWSFGLTVSRIECGTRFCGVTADDPGNYKIKSTNATAFAVNVGAKYFYSEALTFGFNLKDVNTKLNVGIKTTNQDGSTEFKVIKTVFPRDLTFGALWRCNPDFSIALDYQMLFGSYGTYKMDFHIVRAGAEYTHGPLHYRLGLIVPLRLKTDRIVDYRNKLPFPVAPTIGIGWSNKYFNLDVAVYGQPLMSAQRKRPYPAIDVSLTQKF
jgi:hypothetical protein